MFKFLKYFFYLIAIALIAGSVYIATLPSKFDYKYEANFNKIPRGVLKNKLIDFNSWKDWAITDTLLFKVYQSKDPLQSKLESSLVQKQEYRLENEQISDSIIVQKLYTKGEKTIQTLTWNLGNYRSIEKLKLKVDEELSFSDKLFNLIGWKNMKRDWLLSLGENLNVLGNKVGKHAHDYTVSDVKRTSFGDIHYIYMTTSGSLNHLEKQTQKHIIQLEQFLVQQNMAIAGNPFTILNNQLANGDLIFSTALPISKEITIDSDHAIRYAFIKEVPVLSIMVHGNPQNMVNLWENFEKTKEAVLENMSTNQYIWYKTPNNIDNPLDKKQQLIWEINVPEIIEDELINEKIDTLKVI